jgi:hypothetical protein
LNRSTIDVNPQYSESLDFDLFVVHLIFGGSEREFDNSYNPGTLHDLPYLHQTGRAAFEAGLDEVSYLFSHFDRRLA